MKTHRTMLLWSLAALGMLGGCGGREEVASVSGATAIEALHAAGGPKSWIVQLRDGADLDSTFADLGLKHGAALVHAYRHVLHGGALVIPDEASVRSIAADPRVVRIDEDRPVWAVGGKPPPPPPQPAQTVSLGYKLIGAAAALAASSTGAGIHVAVLDTGIDLDHPDLLGNLDLAHAQDCVREAGIRYDDLEGHGTHVAGIIAAVNNAIGVVGVAPGATVAPVKVLNKKGQGAWSTIICGIDYVTANATWFKVANMSLGGPGTECDPASGCTRSALQVAIERSVAAGVTYTVAAGNEGADAAGTVPAAFDAVITVSAFVSDDGEFTPDPAHPGQFLDTDDGWPYYSNYGPDVDIAGPGGGNNYVAYGILSTYPGGTYAQMNGTSMASPHVAGAAAIVLAQCPGTTPAKVRDVLVANGTTSLPTYGLFAGLHKEPLVNVAALAQLACPH